MLRVTNLIGFGGGGSGGGMSVTPGDYSFIGSSVALTTGNEVDWTWTGAAMGAAPGGGETRYIVVTASGQNTGGTRQVTGITLGGSAMTLVKRNAQQTDNTSAIYIKELASGTSANIVVSFNQNVYSNDAVGVYRLINISPTAYDDAISGKTTGDVDLSLDIPSGGVAIAVAAQKNGSGFTWTGIDEKYDSDFNTSDYGSGAMRTSSGMPATVRAQHSAANASGVAASWAPA